MTARATHGPVLQSHCPPHQPCCCGGRAQDQSCPDVVTPTPAPTLTKAPFHISALPPLASKTTDLRGDGNGGQQGLVEEVSPPSSAKIGQAIEGFPPCVLLEKVTSLQKDSEMGITQPRQWMTSCARVLPLGPSSRWRITATMVFTSQTPKSSSVASVSSPKSTGREVSTRAQVHTPHVTPQTPAES